MCVLTIGQDFNLTKLTNAEHNHSEVTTHTVHWLAESLTDGRDEWERVGEREKKWELWVARLLLFYLQHYVFYTSLAGLCDCGPKSSLCTARTLWTASPMWATGFGCGPPLSMPS